MITVIEPTVPLADCGTTILGPDGILAQNLPGYEARQAQVDMANLVGKAIEDRLQAMVEAGTGCIYGDAEVIVNRGGNARRFSLRELIEKFNGGTGPMGDRGGNYHWNSSIPTYVQREAPDGTVRLALLKNAWCSGKKKTFIVTTETGRQIRATDEHPFLTERGWVKLGNLHIGDQVHCVAGQKTTGRQAKPRYRAVYRMQNHPYACRRKNGSAAVDRHRLVAEAALNGLSYEGFTAKVLCGNTSGLNFINPREYEVHHLDRNHTNDTPENLEVLRAGEHPRRHAEEGTYKHVLYKIATEKVVSVKYFGEEMTYDLEVADDPHNFIVNGFVVHNTGKSFGYLIPAILSGQRVVISTDTIALQQQLVDKDLPFLAKILQPVVGREIKFAIAKGRGNFFCERNSRGLVGEGALLKDAGPWDSDLKRMAAGEALRVFQRNEWNGDKATLKLNITDANWAAISGEESCTDTSCQYSQHCPYMLAKQRWEQAEIVVTNHAMYLLHHYVSEKSGGAVGVLPEHGVWVADEAHTIPDRVCDVFGITLKHTAPGAFVRSIERSAKRLGINLDNANPEQIRKCGDSFFASFHGAGKPEMRLDKFPPEILDLARHGMGLLVEQIKPIRLALYWATSDAASSGDEEKAKAIERLYSKADTLIEHLHTLMGEGEVPPAPVEDEDGELMPAAVESPDDWVTYAEVQQRDRYQLPEVTLHRKPIETGPILRRILGRLNASVFTSATLATGEGYTAWKPVAADLGIYLPKALTLQVPAPFDYARQVHGYVPASMPEARSPEYHTVLAMEIDDILHRTQGRAFVLFTSYRDMGRVFDLVSARVRFPLMMQGEKPKDALLEDFLSTPNAVLFGTKTFWTGIDIPGERLTCVVIVKLPFPNHLHPLVEARTQRIEKRGGNSFRDFMLPRCIRDVQQGFGRLIRTKTDRGLFCVLDRRMRESRYGAQIANALPTFPCSGDIEDVPSF